MENKIELKCFLKKAVMLILIFVIGMVVLNCWEYQRYMNNYNRKLNQILLEIKEEYPDVEEKELIQILNQEGEEELDTSWLDIYGIDLEKESFIEENKSQQYLFQMIQGVWGSISLVAVIGVFLKYNQKKDRELEKITRYIEEINQKNYKLDIDDISEDELSILKNEIYKTTVMLKEVAEHSNQAKNDLKDSLSDISHQLKTPLTSISIILDNLIDDSEMPSKVRQDFLHDAKREVRNINFLVQSLLKLSKLDSDTVTFLKEKVDVRKIVEAAIQNVAMLCDLKNVEVDVFQKETDEYTITCDFRWQAEAITNILKNCVEYSPQNSKVFIFLEKNKVYTSITIQDFGNGMDEEEQKHIFERFYKGKNASKDSVGIGLALAKTIVEADRGHVSVQSGKDGTTFVVKYFDI